MTVIAMTREMATGGGEVAAGLAERLNLTIVNHELIEHDIAESSGLSEDQVHRALEGEASLMERLRLDRARMSRSTAQEMMELAAKGNVLIRGWGANFLLRDVPHAVCVRISAPMTARVQRMMARLGIDDPVVARQAIEHSDRAHNGAMQRLFDLDWQDPALYAVMLNTARVPIADCVDQIVRLTRSDAFLRTKKSEAAIMDAVIRARARAALEKTFGQRAGDHGFEAEVEGGDITLTGATTDERLIVQAVRTLQSVPGVRRVSSKVEHVAFTPHPH